MLNRLVVSSRRFSRVSQSKACVLAASAVALSLLAANHVQAADLTYDADATAANGANGGTGAWDLSTANWFDGANDIAWTDTAGTTDAAIFGPSSGTVTLGASLGATGMTFTSAGYTINGSGNTLTLGANGITQTAFTTGTTTLATDISLAANQSWNVGTGSGIVHSGLLTGSANLSKTGGGALTLSGANTGYSGVTTLSAGRLYINNANALGSGNFVITGTGSPVSFVATNVEPNTYIDNTSGAAITIAGNNTMSWNGNSNTGFTFIGTHSLNLGTGAVTMANNKHITVLNNTLTVGGAIADGGAGLPYGITKSGAGTLALSNAANTYQGTTALLGGKISLGTTGQLYTGLTVGALQVVSGELEIQGTNAGPRNQTFASFAIGTGGTNLDGRSVLTAIADPAQPTSLTFTSATPTRIKGSTVLFRGTSMNSAAGNGVGSIVFGTGSGPTVTTGTTDGNFYAASDTVGTGTGKAVFRGALADNSATGNGTGFATYDTTLDKVRVLDFATEQTTIPTANKNVFLTATASSFTGLIVNTLEVNNVSGSNVVQPLSGTLNPINGLLFSGTSPISLSGGAVSGTGSDLILLSTNTSSSGVTISSTLSNASGPGQHSVTFGGPGNFTINSTMTSSSSGGFFFTGPGTVTLNANQSVTSQGLTVGGGTVKFGTSFAMASSRPFKIAAGATIDLNGKDVANVDFLTDLNGAGGTLTNTGTQAATMTITNGSSTGNVIYPFTGSITNGANALNVTLNGIAAATYYWSGSNSYTGNTTVSQGNLRLGANNTLPTSTPLIVNGNNGSIPAVVDLGGYNQQVGSLAGTATASNSFIQNSIVSTTSTLTVNGSNSTSFDGIIRDNAGTGGVVALTKSGSGTLALNGASTYSGSTTINGGTLLVNNTIGSGAVAVSGGGTLGGPGTANGPVTINSTGHVSPGAVAAIGTLTTNGLSFTGGSIYDVDMAPASSDKITSNNGLSVLGGTGFNLFTAGTNSTFSTAGTYTLFSIPSGTIPSLGTLTSNFSILNPVGGITYTWGISGNDITLTLAGGSLAATWTNSTGGAWATGSNWSTNPNAPGAAGDSAIFGTALAGSDQVLLNGNKTIGNISFNNSSASYDIAQGSGGTLTINNNATVATISNAAGNHTISAPLNLVSNTNIGVTGASDSLTISGNISGAGNVAVTGGAGTVVLTGTNSYGTTTVAASNTLAIGNGGTSGTLGSGAATVNGTLSFNRSDTSTVSNVISGSGTVRNQNGTLILTGANTGAWGLDIQGGTVQIGNGGSSGAIGSGPVTNNSALSVDHTGTVTIAGAITGGGSTTQVGGGTLSLTGNNSGYSGSITSTNSTVSFGNSTNSGGSGTLTMNGGTIAASTTAISVNPITTNGTVAINPGANVLTLNGNLTSTAGTDVINVNPSANKLALGGTNNNTFAGTMNVTGSTAIDFNVRTAGSTAAAFNFTTTGTVTLAPMTGTINFGTLSGSSNMFSQSGATSGQSGARVRVGDRNESSTYSGNMTGGLGLYKVGTGSLTLTGQNGFRIDAATLAGGYTPGLPVMVTNGALIAGSSTNGAISGPFGDNTRTVLLGSQALLAGSSAKLATGGAFTVDNPIIVSAGNNTGDPETGYTLTLGGETDNTSTFTGGITLQSNLTIAQVATTGANKLQVTGNIAGTGALTGPSGPGTTLNNTGQQTVIFAGPGAITASGVISDGGGVVSIDSTGGTSTISGLNTYTGTTNSSGGKLLTVNGVKNGNSMTLTNGGVIEVPLNGGSSAVTSISSLSTTGAGSHIQLHDNDLVLNYGANPSSYTDTVNQVKSGLVLLGGTGTEGIASTEVDNQTVAGTMLAVVDDGDPNISGAITEISGFAIPAPTTSILVKFTWFGDSNLDGVVDGSDYALIDTGFTAGGALGGWVFGDYDYSGTIDGSDYALIDTGFLSQTGALPEPTTLGLLGLGAMGMLRRRRQV